MKKGCFDRVAFFVEYQSFGYYCCPVKKALNSSVSKLLIPSW